MKGVSLRKGTGPKAWLLLIGLSWLYIGSLRAQDIEQRDSLMQVWLDPGKADSIRFQACFDLMSNYYIFHYMDSVPYYGQQLFEQAKRAGNRFYQAQSLYAMGVAYENLSQLSEALATYRESLSLWERVGDLERQALLQACIGGIYLKQGQYEEAIQSVEKSLKINQIRGDSLANATTYLVLGQIYRFQGEVFKAMESNQRALRLARAGNLDGTEVLAQFRLANNFLTLGDTDKAMEIYHWAITQYEELGDVQSMIGALNNLAAVLIQNEEYELAIEKLEEALALGSSQGYEGDNVGTLLNLGMVYSLKLDDEKALTYDLAAYELAEKLDMDNMLPEVGLALTNSLSNLERWEEAKAYFYPTLEMIQESGSADEKNRATRQLVDFLIIDEKWKAALETAQAGYEQAKLNLNLQQQQGFTEILLFIYEHYRQFEEALEMHKTYVTLSDSLANEEKLSAVLKQEYSYQYQQQAFQDSVYTATQLALKEQENKRSRTTSYFLIGGLGLTLAFGGILLNRFRLTRRQKQTIEEEKGKLDQAHAQLRELDSFKSRFFTNLSHEFRTPLTVIGGMIDQIMAQPDRWVVAGGNIIKRNVGNLLHLINQILDLRKLESGQLSLSVLQGDVVAFLKLQTEAIRSLADDKQLQLRFLSDQASIMMDFDPDKLLLIHSNLVSNAIKFTPAGGQVEVIVEKPEIDQLSLKVKDTGAGIAPAQLPLIFDRFYQADNEQTRAGEGTGIGLSLTKELVQFMGGDIGVESSLEEGTTFQVNLPITQSAPVQTFAVATPSLVKEAPIALPLSPQHDEAQLPTLLIIEDNPDLITYLYACLEDSYHILLARDGAEGIEMALEQVPDLIVSDVMMPKKNGYEVCHTLKSDERTSHIPIILLTAKADRDSRLTGLKRGADAYLTKPFDQEELWIRLAKLLELRKQLQARYADSPLQLPDQEASFQLEDAFMQKVNGFIQANLENPEYRTEELCRDLGISRTQLHNKIKALTDKSTSLYIRHMRIEKAKVLLKDTDLRISDVGYAVGFGDSHYFSRVFTKETGLSAKEWRTQI